MKISLFPVPEMQKFPFLATLKSGHEVNANSEIVAVGVIEPPVRLRLVLSLKLLQDSFAFLRSLLLLLHCVGPLSVVILILSSSFIILSEPSPMLA